MWKLIIIHLNGVVTMEGTESYCRFHFKINAELSMTNLYCFLYSNKGELTDTKTQYEQSLGAT